MIILFMLICFKIGPQSQVLTFYFFSPLKYRRFFYNRLKVKLSFFVSVQVTRIVLLWVNNHFNDFEGNPEMTQFLENFEKHLETSVSKHRCQCALQSSVLHTDLLSDFLLMPLKFALLSLSVRTCRQCTVKFSLRALQKTTSVKQM